MKRYWIETYGCQMNKAESESLERRLLERNWDCAEGAADADLVIINTCSVRKTAEDRIWGRLGFYKSRKQEKPFKLVLMGCMSERLKEGILEEAPHIDLLVGNFQKHLLCDAIEECFDRENRVELEAGKAAMTQQIIEDGVLREKQPEQNRPGTRAYRSGTGEYHFSELHYNGGFQAYLPIMHGCNNFCTYCIVPYVRGREVSRRPESILNELISLESKGVKEITLLGQNVNSYFYLENGGKGALTFQGLLERITAGIRHIEWVRFLTSHPKDFSEDLIRVIAEDRAVCRHIHLPVQHGSNRILELMGRGYTREQYLELIKNIKKSVSDVSITTDILIGFPGETEKDFRLTLELMEEVEFDGAFTYRYNPREGTPAFRLEDSVPDSEKQKRLRQVIETQRSISGKRKRAKIGVRRKVLVEGVSRKSRRELLARSESDEMVVFPGPKEKIGQFTRVELVSLNGNTFIGKETE